ncbi:MAG: shikimate kinase [Chloroflexia bacterium]
MNFELEPLPSLVTRYSLLVTGAHRCPAPTSSSSPESPPGSGKTTLARALSHQLRWPLIDKDDIRDLTDNEPPGLSYNVMLNIGRRQLLQGLSVICDSPLGYRTTYESPRASPPRPAL